MIIPLDFTLTLVEGCKKTIEFLENAKKERWRGIS